MAESPLAPIGILPVADRWALVTGAARGLGRLIALDLARRGAHLILHARTTGHLDEVASACAPFGKQVVRLGADFAHPSDNHGFLESIAGHGPGIDLVFNNAGFSPPNEQGPWATPFEDYLAAFRINALAPARICQALIPGMLARGFGRIVNLTSSIQGRVNEVAYACSKAALDKLAHDLSCELQGTGVMISLVDPGWLRTDMGGALAPKAAESALPGVLLGALANADVNGCWFTAQDYAGMDLETAAARAGLVHGLVRPDLPEIP